MSWEVKGFSRLKYLLFWFILGQLVVGNIPTSPQQTTTHLHNPWTRAAYLVETWQSMYALDPSSSTPPPQVDRPTPLASEQPLGMAPWAPHLEECHAKGRRNEANDRMGPHGEPPEWVKRKGGLQPPWVRGDDSDNLSHTRQAQSDIWLHHHPRDCANPAHKFLVVSWIGRFGRDRNNPLHAHGLGSELHVMTSFLSLAVAHNRILVIRPHTFMRANHSGCPGSASSNLHCYFSAPTSAACLLRALSLLASNNSKGGALPNEGAALLNSSLPALEMECHSSAELEATTAQLWGAPWLASPLSVDVLGTVQRDTRRLPFKTSWWRAQGIKYLLRFSSPYLCHITNRVRHAAFGQEAALRIARAEIEQLRLSLDLSGGVGVGVAGLDALQDGGWRAGDEPYMPRPIVSVHVRQGDKATEMRLFSFAAHMWMAQRLRFHVPDVKDIWLSTEAQMVVEESKAYRDWRFHYTSNRRQLGNTPMITYESENMKEIVEVSLANLLVASQCDYFIGSLGSNWNRLINELRSTSGRLKAGYISLNTGEC